MRSDRAEVTAKTHVSRLPSRRNAAAESKQPDTSGSWAHDPLLKPLVQTY
ncbi:hypothetical protein ACGFS9_16120 [Streptomyces sp. NPDC048566]